MTKCGNNGLAQAFSTQFLLQTDNKWKITENTTILRITEKADNFES